MYVFLTYFSRISIDGTLEPWPWGEATSHGGGPTSRLDVVRFCCEKTDALAIRRGFPYAAGAVLVPGAWWVLVSTMMTYDDIWWHMMTIDCVMHTGTSLLSTVFLQSTESTFLFCTILFYTFLSICVFSMSRLHSSGLRSAIQESSSPRTWPFFQTWNFLPFVGRPMLQRSERCRNGAANGSSDACSDWPRAAGCAWPRTVVNKGRTRWNR